MENTEELNWRTASFSGANGGQCVEVADHAGTILVRDTKQRGNGQVHRLAADDWRTFVAGVKALGC